MPTSFSRILFLCVSIFLGLPSAIAEQSGPLGFGKANFEDSLTGDRPDFTESTLTIDSGHLQLEGGYLFSYDEEVEEREVSHVLPQTLLRLGLAEGLEARIGWAGYEYSKVTERGAEHSRSVSEGGADMSLGAKLHLFAEDGVVPDSSVIFELSVPAGSRDNSSDEVEPTLKYLWSYEISDSNSVAGNLNFSSLAEDGEHYFQFADSISFAQTLTDAIGAYVEYFGVHPSSDAQDSRSEHYLNGGFTFLLTDNFQLDALCGFGLNGAATDLFTGAGFVFRI